ncbi:SGNH/GDSL hydrolase family protein [Oleiharenicola lentus]|uniref:SGNH/GDSL hydrolase family protein n=1 Tax=Oleiharenicola lentus TaxID=2508720 RepID=UPI003F667D5E
MSLFEHGVCLGDSLTVGARSRYGLAEALAGDLNSCTRKRWLFRSEACSGDTVIQLLRRMDQKPWMWREVTFATLLIGTNDAKRSVDTPHDCFRLLYGQVLDRLLVAKLLVFPALIPLLRVDESLASPYDASCNERITQFNEIIRSECARAGCAQWLVESADFPAECFADGVHFSEQGIRELARRFASQIVSR